MYTPLNSGVFAAAFAGALAGMGVADRTPTDPSPTAPVNVTLANVAGAFAQEIDTLWGANPASAFQLTAVEAICESAWINRNPTETTPAFYQDLSVALLAIIGAGDNYYTAQGIPVSPDVDGSVADLAALGLINDLALANSAELKVLSLLGTPFILDKTSTATVDGITVLATLSGTGRWLRLEFTHPAWLLQAEWYVDPTLGNDENTGVTALLAIKTVGELSRRIGNGGFLPGVLSILVLPIQRIVVNLLGDIPATDPLDLECTLPNNALLAFVGTVTTVRTGTFTNVTAKVRTTNTPWSVEDAVTPFTGADVGRRIRVTAGANINQFAWAAKNTAGVLRTGSFAAPTLPGTPDTLIQTGMATGIVAIGDAYAVETLSKLTIRNLTVSSPLGGTNTASTVGFANIDLQNTGGALQLIPMTPGGVNYNVKGCKFSGSCSWGYGQFRGNLLNCCYQNTIQALAVQFAVTVRGGLALGPVAIRASGVAVVDDDFMVQGAVFGVQACSLQVGAACVFDSPTHGFLMGFFTNEAGILNLAGPSATQLLWGSGNTDSGVFVHGGCDLTYTPAVPTVIGAIADFKLAGSATGSSFDNATGLISTPTIANTWANMAVAAPAGFGGNAHNFERNAHIVVRG